MHAAFISLLEIVAVAVSKTQAHTLVCVQGKKKHTSNLKNRITAK
jgi:hypothetical protein